MTISINDRDIDRVVKWVVDKSEKTDDKTILWDAVQDVTLETVSREFTDNANSWKPISEKYKQEKLEQGFDGRVGIRTGGLMWASTQGATVITTPQKLDWMVNLNHTNSEGERVGDYALKFNSVRRQFQYARKYLINMYKSAIDKWMKGIWE